MPVEVDQLDSLRHWICRTDEHAEARLAVLSQALHLLDHPDQLHSMAGRETAEKLDRWRYQCLGRRSGQVTDEDRHFLALLDSFAGRLTQRPTALARGAREAVLGDAVSLQRIEPPANHQELIRTAQEITAERFGASDSALARQHDGATEHAESNARQPWAGRRMVLYAPLYLSNYCTNYCTYCGFRYSEPTPRAHLSSSEAWQQARVLWERGFRHLLLVAGDFPRLTSPDYLADIIRPMRNEGLSIGVEIAAQSVTGYQTLVDAGASSVTLYQETYDEKLYPQYHPRGSKAAFEWRLEAPDRAAEAGMGRMGLGILLGLSDPWRDLAALIRHGKYLQARFPAIRLSFSLPRIHEAPAGFIIRHPVDDQTMIQMYCLLRTSFPDAHLVLSTRETPMLRDQLARICITQMSAGSSTAPGGYTENSDVPCGGEQFPVCDSRPVDEVLSWLHQNGFEVVWDLEAALDPQHPSP